MGYRYGVVQHDPGEGYQQPTNFAQRCYTSQHYIVLLYYIIFKLLFIFILYYLNYYLLYFYWDGTTKTEINQIYNSHGWKIII